MYDTDMPERKKRDLKIVIFSLIGIFNTLFDLFLYVIFSNLTHSILISNIIATSAALTGSYFLNSKLTFKSSKWSISRFLLFVSVTIFGLWFLQTGFIYLVTPLMHNIPEKLWHLFGFFESNAKIIVPKLLSVVVTFAWNFIWYNKVIFKKDTVAEQITAAIE